MADLSTCPPLTRASVVEAHDLIRHLIHRTPTIRNATIDRVASSASSPSGAKPKLRLWLKCENQQRVGAFKARGAFHALERLKMEPGWLEGGGREKGVVTHSSGNHAQALALAARESSIPAHIVMPTISAPPKIAATRDTYGATVYFSGSTSQEREAMVSEVMTKTGGARLIPPYDHPDIILGQGTLGLELQEDALPSPSNEKKKQLDAILAPCGGGGMLSGVSLSCEGTGIRVFGCEPSFQGADDAKRGFESGQRVEQVKTLTIADGLRTPLGQKWPWHVIYERKLVEGFYNVTEEQIVSALRLVMERCKMVVEPSAVVGLAVALYNEEFRSMVEREAGEDGWDVGVVLTGGNVSLEALGKLFG